MKKTLIYFAIFIFTIGCSPSKKELFKETDVLVESLVSTYESYGILGGAEHTKTTSDGIYTITPIGRLVNVKIQKVVTNDEYEKLRKDLEEHYKNDVRVNDVFICQAGTVMIDCRK
ncbi:MAG: ABC transporter [Paludibacter sp.]|nr:ABC transporter [Paludibacter sp.]